MHSFKQRAKMTNSKKQSYEKYNDATSYIIIVEPKQGTLLAL
jgi:hypothetical protein